MSIYHIKRQKATYVCSTLEWQEIGRVTINCSFLSFLKCLSFEIEDIEIHKPCLLGMLMVNSCQHYSWQLHPQCSGSR